MKKNLRSRQTKLPLHTSQTAKVLDIPRLISQIANLERKAGPSGRDIVDHPIGKHMHDDFANAVAVSFVYSRRSAIQQSVIAEPIAMSTGGARNPAMISVQ